jgi:hypothetical protein
MKARTTLTLAPDVLVMLTRLLRERKTTFKKLVNDALRLGFQQMTSPPGPARKPFRTATFGGTFLLDNVDDVAEVLATVEGEDYK